MKCWGNNQIIGVSASNVTVKLKGGANLAGVASTFSQAVTGGTVAPTVLAGASASGKLCSVHIQKGSGSKLLVKDYQAASYTGDANAGTVATAFGATLGTDALTFAGVELKFSVNSTNLVVTTQDNFVVGTNDAYKVIVTHGSGSDCASSTFEMPLTLNSADATSAAKKSVAASGILVIPHGLATDPDTAAPHKNVVVIDGVPISLGATELNTADKVADKMIIVFTTVFAPLAAADIFELTVKGKKVKIGESYQKSPYEITKQKGLGKARCGEAKDKHKPTKDTVCLRFTRIVPGRAGNGILKVTNFNYAKYVKK